MGKGFSSGPMMKIGGLMLGLFVLMIITAVVFIGQGYVESTLCTQADSDWVYENGQCLNATGGTEQTVAGITAVGVIAVVFDLILGLIALIVLVLLFKEVIKVAKEFSN